MTRTNPGVDPRVEALGLKPKVLARLRAVGADAEFGRLITIGTPSRFLAFFGLLAPLIFCSLGAGALISGLNPGSRPPGSTPPSREIWAGIALIAASLVMLALLVWCIWARSVQWRFFEHGVTKWRRGIDLQRLSYLDVTALSYKLTRQYYNGIYIGTSGLIKLETEKGSKTKGMSYQFRHREKAKGIIKREFEGVDPLDFVRDAVADAVSERLAMEIAEKGSVPWTGPATFTKEGLSVKKLLGGVSVLPYETIDRMAANAGTLTLFQEGQPKGVISLAVNGKNFYPGMALLRRLVAPARPSPEPVELFEDED